MKNEKQNDEDKTRCRLMLNGANGVEREHTLTLK